MGSVIKILILKSRLKDLDKIEDDFENFFNLPHIGENEEDKLIMKKRNKKYMILSMAYSNLGLITISVWMAAPILDPEFGRYIVAFPFYTGDDSPQFEIIYVYLSFMLIMWSSNIELFDLIICGLFDRIITHFEILIRNVNEINEDDKNTEKKIKNIIIHHQAVLR